MKIYSSFKFKAKQNELYANISDLDEFDYPPYLYIYDEIEKKVFRAEGATLLYESTGNGPTKPIMKYFNYKRQIKIHIYFDKEEKQ